MSTINARSSARLYPGDKFPRRENKLVQNGEVSLFPEHELQTLIVCYRGCFDAQCREQLRVLEESKEMFRNHGIQVIAVSADTHQSALKTIEDLQLNFPVYCELSVSIMRDWALFVTDPLNYVDPSVQPNHFS